MSDKEVVLVINNMFENFITTQEKETGTEHYGISIHKMKLFKTRTLNKLKQLMESN